jgi:hypothetical protein
MSEKWPNGWYRDEQGRPAQPGFTPRQDAQGSPYEPTQAVPPWAPSLSQLASVAFALKTR